MLPLPPGAHSGGPAKLACRLHAPDPSRVTLRLRYFSWRIPA